MIELKTLDKSRVNPVDDGVLYNALAGESGILTGCGLTAVGGAQVQIRDGYLILCGRVCKVSQEVLYANLSANGTQEGQLVTVIDLSNAENPIKFETRLPKGELMQGDINAGGTIYELEIATYTANELSVKSITTTANKIGLAKEKTLGQPSGIATLDSNGKLVQMPTAADVGAVPSESTIRLRVTEDDAVPHYADANDYKIPGQRISISPQVTAVSVDNLPETNSGQLCVYGFDSNTVYQTYETFWGTRWIRQYTISTGAWGTWMGGRPKSITIPGVAGAITSDYVGWAYKNPFGEVNLGIWADLSAPVNSSTFRAIGTLPEGYRPSAYETIETIVELRGSSSGLEAGIISIGNSGKIQVARAVGSSSSGLNMVRGQVNFYVG